MHGTGSEPGVVLHVVESYASGVAMAVQAYVANTPWLEHHLVYSTRKAAPVGAEALSGFATTELLPNGKIGAWRGIRHAVRRLRPSVIHAHSSFAGFFVRTGVSRRGFRIIYTPHCYSFERRDISKAMQTAYRIIEQVLSLNTTAIVGCSPREVAISRRMWSSEEPVYVPNVPPAALGAVSRATSSVYSETVDVVGLGRIGPQKGPKEFARIVADLRESGLSVSATWIGGGDSDLEDILTDADVFVTGWVSPDEAYQRLAKTDIYVHSAEWEGFPVSILEATALQVPVLVRDIPAFDYVPRNVKDSQALASLSQALSSSDSHDAYNDWRDNIVATWKYQLSENTDHIQAERLRTAYSGQLKFSEAV